MTILLIILWICVREVVGGLAAGKAGTQELHGRVDPKTFRQALRTFKTMRHVYLEKGIPSDVIDSRLDNFARNYIRFVEIDKIKGKTFTSKLNSIELLSDEELTQMFGLVPDFPDHQNTTPKHVTTLEELEQTLGVDAVNEASLVFARLRPHFKEYGVTQENEKQRLVWFIESYQKFYGKKRKKSSVEVTKEAVKNPKIIKLLADRNSHEKQAKFLLDENLSDIDTDDIAVPDPSYSNHFEVNMDYNSLGEWLTSEHYDTQAVEECEKLKATEDIQVDRTCLEGGKAECVGVKLNRRCFSNINGIPDEFLDWESLGYVRSLLHYRAATTLPAGWAHTSTQIMDMYQQIYSKNVTYYRHDLSNLFHMMNCVYRTSGLGRGSPQAAFQYMSDKTVVPKFGEQFPGNCREGAECFNNNTYHDVIGNTMIDRSHGDIFYKFLYMWDKGKDGMDKDYCDDTTTFEPTKTAIPEVTFLPGKAYIQFSDTSQEETWVISDHGHNYLDTVGGEAIVKPLLYKKGPLAVMMVACYELFYTSDGVFNFDCTLSTRKYLPQWVVLISYGTDWFGTVMPKMFGSLTTFEVDYPTIMKISRKEDHVFRWNSFVLPRVSPYYNSNNCQNDGISLPNGKCFCPTDKYGSQCQAECKMTCKNGGHVSHVGCKCECPNTHYGKHCGKPCECHNNGMCDEEGNCICHRQVSWGKQCQNTCSCNNNGYCHIDGSCECLAGFAGPECDRRCKKECSYPKVCWYSNSVTDSGFKIDEFCACPHGFYGDGCNTRIDCQHEDLGTAEQCQKLKSRSRCNTEEAMEKCPTLCGHCFIINTATGFDD